MLEANLKWLGHEESEHEESNSVASSLYLRLTQIMQDEDGIQVVEVDSLPDGIQGLSYHGLVDVVRVDSPVRRFHILVHEYAHELLHWKPDRNSLSRFDTELQAHLVTLLVTGQFSLEDTDSVRSLQQYTSAAEASLITKTANQIINKLKSPDLPN